MHLGISHTGKKNHKAKPVCILIYFPQASKFLHRWREANCVCRTPCLTALHGCIRVIWHYHWSQTTRELYLPLTLLLQPRGFPASPHTTYRDSMITEQVISDGWSITPLLEQVTGNREVKVNSYRLVWQSATTATGIHSCRYEKSRLLLLNCLTELYPCSHPFCSLWAQARPQQVTGAWPRAQRQSPPLQPPFQRLRFQYWHSYLFPLFPNIHSHSQIYSAHWSRQQYKIKLENSSCTAFIQQLTHSRACTLVMDCCHPEQVWNSWSNPQAVFLLFRRF